MLFPGSIDLELDTQTLTLATANIVLYRAAIRRGTDSGSEPCLMAYVSIDAASVATGGKASERTGQPRGRRLRGGQSCFR